MMGNKILGQMICKIGKQIESGECGLDDDELNEIANIIGTKKMTLEEATNYLGISRTTLGRKITDGSLPKPRKKPGSKKYYFKKDLDKSK